MLKPGTNLDGKFTIERMLGRGGMGEVYLARHNVLGNPVAIKLLQRSAIGDTDKTSRFLVEAKTAACLDSEHVAKVLDAGTSRDGEPYLVMEYLSGYDLEVILKNDGRMSIPTAVGLVLQAMEGLAVAHANGIVHRDIKPANLFLCERKDGTRIVKVLDFGLAKARYEGFATLTQSDSVFGSPVYMSPEQLRASVNVDVRADIWSLGVCLFQMVTTELPFVGVSQAEFIAAVLSREPRPLSDFFTEVPAGLQDVISKCLEKRLERRFSNLYEMAMAVLPYGEVGTSTASASRIRVLFEVAQAAPELRQRVKSTPELALHQEADTAKFLPKGDNGLALSDTSRALSTSHSQDKVRVGGLPQKGLRRNWGAFAVLAGMVVTIAGVSVWNSDEIKALAVARDSTQAERMRKIDIARDVTNTLVRLKERQIAVGQGLKSIDAAGQGGPRPVHTRAVPQVGKPKFDPYARMR